jgi:hypothetical protein
LYKLTLLEQAQLILQLRVSVFDLLSRFLAPPPLAAGSENFSTTTQTRFWRPCPKGSFERTMAVMVIIAMLVISAMVRDV